VTSLYEVSLFNHTGILQRKFTDWESMSFTQRINAAWNHNIRFSYNIESENADYILNTMEDDWIFEIDRTDLLTGLKKRVYEGFHRTTVDQLTLAGRVILNLYGSGYTELLKRRLVEPLPGLEHNKKTGVAETIMKEFVEESAISPENSERVIVGLSNQEDVGYGNIAEYSARYTQLPTVLKRLAEQGGVDFGVIRPDSAARGTFEFVVLPLWGVDRRVDNVEGRPPIVFSTGLGNMVIPIFSRNSSEEINYVYVGGQGQGLERRIIELSNEIAIARSPWNRREDFLDARQESSDEGLITSGTSELETRRVKETLTFDVRQTDSVRWNRDWGLGDIITSYHRGKRFDKKITEVSVNISPEMGEEDERETLSVELRDPTLVFEASEE
jgi:hypothetical protein